ncbi:MAG: hypothetical protein ABR999_08290 [Methanoregula sp.]|jgi:hypothetical protein|uniref:hypothetical protein n=1 Tax=Methanoregula sp. TaxID=2052170 RepID=UPI003D106A36
MAKKDGVESLLIVAILIIIAIIYYVILWIIANWIPILIILIIIGIAYGIIEWQKDNQFQKEQQKKKYEQIEREKRETAKRIELEKQMREFEKQQNNLGLIKYTDRFGKILWGTPAELELWKQKEDEEKIKDLLINKIVNAIEKFCPTRNWEYEDGYHKELLGYLKHDFPDIKYEFQMGSSRPDLVIQNIAIEIKGPTDNAALETLTTKCLKYSKYYDHLIMVLFNPQFSEKNFKEIQAGINQYFPHVKIIRK